MDRNGWKSTVDEGFPGRRPWKRWVYPPGASACTFGSQRCRLPCTCSSCREGLEFGTAVESDTAPLHGLVAAMLETGADVHVLRDPTRGGC